VSGAGFGSAEENRRVEKAACRVACGHFKKRGYKVESRESEDVGYDFDVWRRNEALHVEVKGIAGSSLKFVITANEVRCAKTDQVFCLAVVTEACSKKPRIHIFDSQQFMKRFKIGPIAFVAKYKP
jgi:hypothetical protein